MTDPAPGALGARPGVLLDALVFLCRHFDLPVSEAEVRAGIAGAVAEVDPAEFMRHAARLGLAAAAGRQPLDEVRDHYFPLVVLQDDGHALVLLGRAGAASGLPGYLVHDPALDPAPVVLDAAAVEAGYSGYAIAVRPRPVHTAARVDLDRRGHWFWGAIAANRWSYGQVALAAVVTNVLGLTVSIFTMVVYDRILPNEAIESLIALTAGVVIAIVVDFVIKTIRARYIDRAGQKADLAMGGRIFDHVLDMQMRSRRGSAGAFASLLREFESLRDFFTSASLAAFVDLPFVLLFVFVIYLIGGPLAVVPLVAVLVILVLGVAIQPLLGRYAAELSDEGRTKHGVLVETIAGLETIKTCGAAPLMRKRWEDSIRQQSGVGAKTRDISQLLVNATAFAQQASQVGIVFFGVFLIAAGTISMGALIACVILVGRAMAPLGQLAQLMTRVNQARTSYASLDRMMAEPTERQGGRHYVAQKRLRGRIEFRGVSFTYPGQSAPALKDVSFVIEPGQRVALLGRVGSGKSTVMRLLLGLYEPDSGAILVDDTDIRQIDPANLRANLAVVLQDVWLFTGTVRENIAIGARHPTDEGILRAARVAGVHDFVGVHPAGYDLVLAERGEGLSGGQRQAIALARALVADAPLLVLDEPTSSMDVQSEEKVISRLKASARGQTIVVVTHRSSLLELVDHVIVLDGGRLALQGPKAVLAAQAARPRMRVGDV